MAQKAIMKRGLKGENTRAIFSSTPTNPVVVRPSRRTENKKAAKSPAPAGATAFAARFCGYEALPYTGLPGNSEFLIVKADLSLS